MKSCLLITLAHAARARACAHSTLNIGKRETERRATGETKLQRIMNEATE